MNANPQFAGRREHQLLSSSSSSSPSAPNVNPSSESSSIKTHRTENPQLIEGTTIHPPSSWTFPQHQISSSILPKCALTQKEIRDPVLASDGHTYEREALERYLRTVDPPPRSPVTQEVLNRDIAIPNRAVAKLIAKFRALTMENQSKDVTITTSRCDCSMSDGQSRTIGERPRLNCRISSDLEELNKLHASCSWIPSSEMIRPTPETILRKEQFFSTVLPQYETECDFVLHSIFGMEAKRDPTTGKLKVSHFAVLLMKPHSLRRTLPNLFPYKVPPGTLHFVHWAYPHFSPLPEIDEAETNEAIQRDLKNHFGPEAKFEFVWDVNPKMSLPHDKSGCMHAHVFVHLI